MDKTSNDKERANATPSASSSKQPWVKPQVTFVKPQLTKHGGLAKVTGQSFFGAFSPGADD